MSEPFPPPPGNLTPPPGYVGYQPSPMGSVPLRRVGGTGRALTVLLIVYTVVGVLATILSQTVIGSAEDYLDGTISEDELTDDLAPVLGVGLVQFGLMIAVVVLTIIWMHRIAGNHRQLGRATTWGPGWAIASWFVPPFLFVIPLLMLVEIWKAAEPTSPPGDEGWKQARVSPVIPIWWVLYGPLALVLVFFGRNPFSGFGGDVDDAAQDLVDDNAITLAQSLVNVAAAVVFVLLVRGLTDRHVRLTGEATAR